MRTSAILLAGGQGSRMNSKIAKQYLELNDKPLILYSYETFLESPEIDEIVVVCSPEYQRLFHQNTNKRVVFALPGERRQDSVYNGMMAASADASFICVHDGARPFMTLEAITKVLKAANSAGAAAIGTPVRYTIKQVDRGLNVQCTPDRSTLWEMQTPQVVAKEVLVKGFAHAKLHGITVTDDVSLAELVGNKVKLVEGSHDNIKITVPSDLIFAHQILKSRHA
jgi:2-C-methyl-D-erythritol 4-phosphate cytidylyltransferase